MYQLPLQNAVALPAKVLTTAFVAFSDKSCWVDLISFSNIDTADRTINVTDGAGTTYIAVATILGTSSSGGGVPVDWPIPGGFFFKNGIKASASVNSKVAMFARVVYAS